MGVGWNAWRYSSSAYVRAKEDALLDREVAARGGEEERKNARRAKERKRDSEERERESVVAGSEAAEYVRRVYTHTHTHTHVFTLSHTRVLCTNIRARTSERACERVTARVGETRLERIPFIDVGTRRTRKRKGRDANVERRGRGGRGWRGEASVERVGRRHLGLGAGAR